jgi:undecaprenyl diphosphate synthase
MLVAVCGLWYLSIWYLKPLSTSRADAGIQHLGIIMDGNRRWARKRGFAPWLGHRQGADPVKTTIKFCLEHKIPYLTLYAFSLENFKRSPQELDFLFNVLAQELVSKELGALFERGVRVRFVGDRSYFPAQLVKLIDEVEEKTKEGKKLTLIILFCYGGRQEIVHAVRTLAQAVKKGDLTPEQITPDLFEEYLWTGRVPAPDLIIRTGGMKRLSNFLSYQSAYSELYFLDCYWPEITEQHLNDALREYHQRLRSFGT